MREKITQLGMDALRPLAEIAGELEVLKPSAGRGVGENIPVRLFGSTVCCSVFMAPPLCPKPDFVYLLAEDVPPGDVGITDEEMSCSRGCPPCSSRRRS